MSLYLSGIALVTGAGAGIGKATAIAYAGAGVRGIVLAGRTENTLLQTEKELKALATNSEFDTLIVLTDITVEAQCKALLDKSVEKFGRVDYAANCAGALGPLREPFGNTTNSTWNYMQDVNIHAMFYLLREEVRVMKTQDPLVTPLSSPRRPAERGAIIVVTSGAATITIPGSAPYVTGKWAALGLAKSAAFDHAQDGIRINAVLPGYTLSEGLQNHPSASPEALKHLAASNALNRIAETAEVGDTITFLSSPRSSFMVGSGLVVDGGATLTCE